MNRDDVELLESLLTEIVGSLMPAQSALRNAGLALEILRRLMAEHGPRSDLAPADLIDDGRFTVRWNGAECHLGWTVSFRLFRRLARPANRYVSTELLLEDVWGDERTEDTTVRSAVRNLRHKLEEAGMPELAEAIQGQPGHYRLRLDREARKE